MKYEFKPGDQALIVRARHPDNIGRVVELIRFDDREVIPLPECGHWSSTPNPKREAAWVVRGDCIAINPIRGAHHAEYGVCPQAWLMPLRGDEDPDAHLATSAPRAVVTGGSDV